MNREDLELLIRDFWKDAQQYPDFETAGRAIDLQARFGPSGNTIKNLIGPEEIGEQAVRKILGTLIYWGFEVGFGLV